MCKSFNLAFQTLIMIVVDLLDFCESRAHLYADTKQDLVK